MKRWYEYLPGGIFSTTNLIGGLDLVKMAATMGWNYRRTFFHLLQRGDVRSAINLLYTKAMVPVGEGAGAAAYFALGPVVRRFPWLAPLPSYTEIEVSTVCNKKCIHCEYQYWGKSQERRFLEFDEFVRMAEGFPSLRWLHLTGEGSSFLNPDYLKMLRWTKQRGISVYLVDHLDDMDEPLMRELIELGVDGVYISIDGASPQTYNALRVGCDFDRVVSHVRRFVELKRELRSRLPELSFRYVITTDNVHEMPAYVDLVASFGTRDELGDGSRIDFVGVLEFPEIQHLYVPTIDRAILDATVERLRHHGLWGFFSHIEEGRNPRSSQCICWLEPYILMGGHVLPCCTVLMSNKRPFLRQESFGNLLERPITEVWRSPKYRTFRRIINDDSKPVPTFCVGCRAYQTAERERRHGIVRINDDGTLQQVDRAYCGLDPLED